MGLIISEIQYLKETFGKGKETFGKGKETFGKGKETPNRNSAFNSFF